MRACEYALFTFSKQLLQVTLCCLASFYFWGQVSTVGGGELPKRSPFGRQQCLALPPFPHHPGPSPSSHSRFCRSIFSSRNSPLIKDDVVNNLCSASLKFGSAALRVRWCLSRGKDAGGRGREETNGWTDGWTDGWMDGWVGGMKRNCIESLCETASHGRKAHWWTT